MRIIENDKFKKDFKKLLKKYKSLEDDFNILKQVILAEPVGDGTRHWNLLKQNENKYLFKTRMMCRSVKGSSFRVIYFLDGEKIEIIFIEIYFKGQKESEDKKRIEDFWKTVNQ